MNEPQTSGAESMDVEGLSKPNESLQISQIDEQLNSLQHKIEVEEEKFKNWKIENIRRKHNYIPFLVNLLKILAEKEELIPLIQQAQKLH